MAQINRIAAARIRHLKVGLHNDGAGLYAQITTGKQGQLRRSWLFRYTGASGKERWMGLGSMESVTLAQARDKRDVLRRQLAAGLDPLALKEEEKAKAAEVAADGRRRAVTFLDYAKAYVANHEGTWRNDKHRQQWLNSLGLPGGGKRRMTYCDTLHATAVADICIEDVRLVLDKLWNVKPETASRIRGRIERILSAAATDKLRAGPNPAAWKDNLANIYPKKKKVRAVRHHMALPWAQIPGFMTELRQRRDIAAKCLGLLVLTAVRSQEARGAVWDEFDLENARWLIPAPRMKRGVAHMVPLSEPAVALLRRLQALQLDERFVFPGDRGGKGISDTALRNVLRDLGLGKDDASVHGFRSSFRSWSAENTHASFETCEFALAHGISDATAAAYYRTDQFTKRIPLMAEWGTYCTTVTAPVCELEPA
jgi:integrase